MTSKIKSFFQNQTVLLTGGTGFLGKVLIEKLLRECEGIKKIYIVVRSKKNKTPEERLEDLFKFECFDPIKSTNPDLLNKICLVSGDCYKPNLGIKKQDISTLIKETTCFIYAAANVKFDQTLKEASWNVRAVRDALELAKQMPNLKVFVFVSTLWSNCVNQHIKEEFYPPPLEAKTLLSIVKDLDDNTLIAVTPTLVSKWPNTYVFSKSISEDLVRNAGEHFPVAIVRPPVIAASAKEPMEGWNDNFLGYIGLAAAASLGVVRFIYCNTEAIAWCAPVDYVSNCILAAAWKRELCGSTTIYNYSGHNKNLITWKKVTETAIILKNQVATNKMVWYPYLQIIESKTWYHVCIFLMHLLPAYSVDLILICLGRSPKAVKGYQRLHKAIDGLSYFNTINWKVDHDNTTKLWNEMNSEDKQLFKFDMEYFNWPTYIRNLIRGARIYLLKDPIKTLPQAKRKMKLLFIVHYTVIALFWYLVYKLLMFTISLFV